jgi:hypothetical protein
MALPAVAAAVMRRCVPAAVVLIGSLTPLVGVGPAWSSPTTAPSAGSAAEELTGARTAYGDAVKAVELIGAQRERLAAPSARSSAGSSRGRLRRPTEPLSPPTTQGTCHVWQQRRDTRSTRRS